VLTVTFPIFTVAGNRAAKNLLAGSALPLIENDLINPLENSVSFPFNRMSSTGSSPAATIAVALAFPKTWNDAIEPAENVSSPPPTAPSAPKFVPARISPDRSP
jgi:hypothetical protein